MLKNHRNHAYVLRFRSKFIYLTFGPGASFFGNFTWRPPRTLKNFTKVKGEKKAKKSHKPDAKRHTHRNTLFSVLKLTIRHQFLAKTIKRRSYDTCRYPPSHLTLQSRLRQLYTRRNQRAFWIGRLWKFGSCDVRSQSHLLYPHQPLVSYYLFGAKLSQFFSSSKCIFAERVFAGGLRERGGKES